ncbi:xylogen-like protein 11-like [Dorcoceras hygrometricum]|uniref:Xylogen-like protein 11-like n=1 Tax=Dorcoceras hygrometricum TaxID=472368 RepID=A0A2Z7BIV8_9LAMI|nr:xylogen-like protein 11-like [Dorcoceras hygrometricum]
MHKAKTNSYTLIIAAVFLASTPLLPCTNAQSLATAPMIMAPAPSLDCFPYVANMSDCLTYVEPGSGLMEPDPGCCPELSHLVDTQPICLCELLSDPNKLGISIDKNKALMLPSVCRVNTPPLSACADAGEPVSIPSPTEGPSQGNSGPRNEYNGGPKLHFLVGLAILLSTSLF